MSRKSRHGKSSTSHVLLHPPRALLITVGENTTNLIARNARAFLPQQKICWRRGSRAHLNYIEAPPLSVVAQPPFNLQRIAQSQLTLIQLLEPRLSFSPSPKMATHATDPEVAPASGLEAVQPGLQFDDSKGATNRKPSGFRNNRKLSVIDPNAHVVDADELSEADRRLAEMGYVQVSTGTLSNTR